MIICKDFWPQEFIATIVFAFRRDFVVDGRVRRAGPPAVSERGTMAAWRGGDEASVPAAIEVPCAAGYTGHGIIFHNIPYAHFVAIALPCNSNTPLPEMDVISEA